MTDRLLARGEKLPFFQVARHGGVACGARIVCYHDDGFLKFSVQSGEYIENLFGRVRVQVARGFIGHEQRGVSNNGARNRHPLFLTAGELSRKVVHAVFQTDQFQGGANMLSSCLRGELREQQG